ncbi:leucine-rich repeat domain-containing protein [Bradymonadaceae bacterium TMQ3]|nr:leucine-rich repeat domain-containing protein [Bradymonadaceae bacterium TMQ3]
MEKDGRAAPWQDVDTGRAHRKNVVGPIEPELSPDSGSRNILFSPPAFLTLHPEERMTFPPFVFVYPPEGNPEIPRGTRLLWYPSIRELSFSPAGTTEHLDELIATGLVDDAESIRISDFAKKAVRLPDSIARLTSLRSVRIETSQFADWPGVYRISTLRTLFVDEKVTALPDGIGQLKALEELTIKGKKIASLPEDLGSLPNLRTLVIVNAPITHLPDLSGLTALQTLRLVWTRKLKVLPDGLDTLAALERVETDMVPLTEIPVGLAQHANLRALVIRGGKVKKLPDVSWPQLRELENFGPLKKLPKTFEAPALEHVVLGDALPALPPLPADSLQSLDVNAPLTSVDPALASVNRLRLTCTKQAYAALSDDEREAFGARLRAAWQ